MISVVMITMNEEKAVGEVIRGIRNVMDDDTEILIVDSSHDRTPEIARELGATVIRQYPPQGYGMAMDLALRSASGQVIVTLDCDNTYPVDAIAVLANDVLANGYDVVDGSRLRRKPESMPWVNYVANVGFAWLASLMFLKRITDLHSGMRAYRKDVITRIRYNPNGAALPVELLLRPLKDGYKVKTVFISYHDRVGSSTMKPLQSAWWTLKRILSVRFS